MTDGPGNDAGARPGISASPAHAPPEASPRPERLRALLHAHTAVAAELDLHAVLRRVVLAARELVDARYAAVGVFGRDGVFDEFVHIGIDLDTLERIGQPPASCGVLALQAAVNGPVRLGDLRADPAFSGFPPHHPIMTGCLGMPIRIQDRAVGTLYVTDSANGEFSAEDEQLVVSLAGVAAVAIDNARLRRRSELRDRWSTVSTAVSRQLLAGHGDHSLELILRSARDTASADFATLALLVEPGELQVKATIGAMADGLIGRTAHTRGGLVGPVARTRTPVQVDGPDGPDGAADAADVAGTLLPARVGSFIIVPLTAGGTVTGTLNVGRVVGAPAFTTADTGHLARFAGQVGIAMELDHTRAHRPARLVTEDHDRFDTDLHQHVINELAAVALGLQGLVATSPIPENRPRLNACINRLDATVRRIRSEVYGHTISERRHDDLHHRLLTLLDVHAPALGHPVGIRFTRLADQPLPPGLADDVLTVVRDTMTDLAQHDGASQVDLRVDITDDLVLVEITSNGNGSKPLARADLLTALRRSAGSHAGTLRYFNPSAGGGHLVWTAHNPNGRPRTDNAI
jgi:GAF domain-containing protein